MSIPKLPPPAAPSRSVDVYKRARQGWLQLVGSLLASGRIKRVLMPAYVGRSPSDGSGLWDPLTDLDAPIETYRTDRRTFVDVEDLEQRVRRGPPPLVLLVHYFGFPQPALERIAQLVHGSSGVLVEDCAHSLLSEVAYGACGNTGDFTIYSFVKLLGRGPGAIVDNTGSRDMPEPTGHAAPPVVAEDWIRLSHVRRRNYDILSDLVGAEATLVHPELPSNVVPQSLPVLVPPSSRHAIYDSLNDQGFGATALWHTLAHAAGAPQDAEARWLSHRILNLPVHAADPSQTELMARALLREVRRVK